MVKNTIAEVSECLKAASTAVVRLAEQQPVVLTAWLGYVANTVAAWLTRPRRSPK